MKKLFTFTFAIIFVLTVVVTSVGATMVSSRTLNGGDGYTFLVNNVGNDFHTTVYPTYKNEPVIRVKSDIKRKVNGVWQSQTHTIHYVSTINECYHYNVNLKGVETTRGYFQNLDSGTRVIADLYIDPDHMN